jgi:DNA-binding CsgD family transcriptional regulator
MKPHRRKTLGPVSSQELIDVIGSIYDAALDIVHWQTAMARIAKAVDAHRALMFVPGMKSSREFCAAHDIDPGMLAGYAEYYRHKDLWTLRSYDILTRAGSAGTGELTVSQAEYLKSEFWNDFTRPADIFHSACVMIANSGPSPSDRRYLAVYRPRRSEPFDRDALAFLRTIQPHVLRSLKLGLQLSSAAAERSILEAMLGAVATPMIACTADACVRYANAAAAVLLREDDGLSTDRLRLVAAAPLYTDQLARAIGQASGVISPDASRAGHTLQVPERSTGRPMTITVMPLPRNDDRLLGTEGATALVIVHRHKRPRELELARLCRTYALTGAEAKLVVSMLDGGALPEVATRLGIGYSTARTHLRHVFAKTQTRRQAELLQLVQGLAR